MITITGIATAAISNGHKLTNSQSGVIMIAKINMRGKEIEAIIEANETYRHTKTTAAHIIMANKAQIV